MFPEVTLVLLPRAQSCFLPTLAVSEPLPVLAQSSQELRANRVSKLQSGRRAAHYGVGEGTLSILWHQMGRGWTQARGGREEGRGSPGAARGAGAGGTGAPQFIVI